MRFFLPLLVKIMWHSQALGPIYSAASHLGIFCLRTLWWILLGLLHVSCRVPHFIILMVIFESYKWDWSGKKRRVLPAAIFMFDKDDTLPKIIQYEHSSADHKTIRRIGMGVTVYFLITVFRFVYPWFSQNTAVSREAVSEHLLWSKGEQPLLWPGKAFLW